MSDWVDILNRIDECLGNIIYNWRSVFIMPNCSAEVSISNSTQSFSEAFNELQILLRFTTGLLSSSINKELYNSAEVRNCKL